MMLGYDDVQPHRLRLLVSMGFTDPKFLTTIIEESAEYIHVLQTRVQMLLESEQLDGGQE